MARQPEAFPANICVSSAAERCIELDSIRPDSAHLSLISYTKSAIFQSSKTWAYRMFGSYLFSSGGRRFPALRGSLSTLWRVRTACRVILAPLAPLFLSVPGQYENEAGPTPVRVGPELLQDCISLLRRFAAWPVAMARALHSATHLPRPRSP